MFQLQFRQSALATALVLFWIGSSAFGQAKRDEHAHPEHGPHNGQLIELGDEEYHAELIDDEKTATVTIYLLDGKAKGPVGVESPTLTINVRQGRKPLQFQLKAAPQKGDGQGTSSRFVLKNKQLVQLLDNDKAEKRLRVTIKGKAYNAKIEHHHHDHDDGESNRKKKD